MCFVIIRIIRKNKKYIIKGSFFFTKMKFGKKRKKKR